jgi:hypothetical protein
MKRSSHHNTNSLLRQYRQYGQYGQYRQYGVKLCGLAKYDQTHENANANDIKCKQSVNNALIGNSIKNKKSEWPSLKMGYLNARSIVNKLPEVEEFLSSNNLDLLSISESWLFRSVNSNCKMVPRSPYVNLSVNKIVMMYCNFPILPAPIKIRREKNV